MTTMRWTTLLLAATLLQAAPLPAPLLQPLQVERLLTANAWNQQQVFVTDTVTGPATGGRWSGVAHATSDCCGGQVATIVESTQTSFVGARGIAVTGGIHCDTTDHLNEVPTPGGSWEQTRNLLRVRFRTQQTTRWALRGVLDLDATEDGLFPPFVGADPPTLSVILSEPGGDTIAAHELCSTLPPCVDAPPDLVQGHGTLRPGEYELLVDADSGFNAAINGFDIEVQSVDVRYSVRLALTPAGP